MVRQLIKDLPANTEQGVSGLSLWEEPELLEKAYLWDQIPSHVSTLGSNPGHTEAIYRRLYTSHYK